MRKSPTLGQVFALSLLGLIVLLGLLFYLVSEASRRTLTKSSERIRDNASREISGRVTKFLAAAPDAVKDFQQQVSRGLVNAHSPQAVETSLFALLLSNQNLGEVTLTYGHRLGFDENGAAVLAKEARGQVSLVRTPAADSGERFWSRDVSEKNGVFVAERRELGTDKSVGALPPQSGLGVDVPDPTSHPTFITPARADFRGDVLWSDLHWSQLDAALPEAQRRVEVSVQKVVTDAAGEFVGVLRVGLLTRQLDRAVQITIGRAGEKDPHRIFICDSRGRFITRLAPNDPVVESGDDLRVAPKRLPPEIVSALADSRLRAVSATTPSVSGEVRSGGQDVLTTFRALPETQDWLVGIVVPRAYYLGDLTAIRNQLLAALLGIMVLLVGVGGFILRGVKRAQAQVARESMKMNAFDFSAAPTASIFRDVSAVLVSLEKAKTAMRAMGKYVPINLVRRLYQETSEPTLGGDMMEISIMFTDIQNFTALSEMLTPDDLAETLGRYLEVMGRIIQQETGGTIDKFIGDAIMTFWNAPERVANHSRLACRAALSCRAAGRALSQSPEWRELPRFETRFGLHRDKALVGHFGAPDRMNYTAMGDGVNLASRLEGLNKHYGTTIIASEQIYEHAHEHFDFRLLDLVAVKGKSTTIKVYELLGEKEQGMWWTREVESYERALRAYVARDFGAAIAILEEQRADPPSAVLLERCCAFQETSPPPDWEGAYVATSK